MIGSGMEVVRTRVCNQSALTALSVVCGDVIARGMPGCGSGQNGEKDRLTAAFGSIGCEVSCRWRARGVCMAYGSLVGHGRGGGEASIPPHGFPAGATGHPR